MDRVRITPAKFSVHFFDPIIQYVSNVKETHSNSGTERGFIAGQWWGLINSQGMKIPGLSIDTPIQNF
jgi:hypothetical protein